MSKDYNIYKFEDFELDEEESKLFKSQVKIDLEPKQIQTLLLLVKKAGLVVTKDEFFSEVWKETSVEETSLTKCISEIRKKIDKPFNKNFIETIPGKGYKFLATVEEVAKSRQTLVKKGTTTEELPEDVELPKFEDHYIPDSQFFLNNSETASLEFGFRNTNLAILGMVISVIFFFFGLYQKACKNECYEQNIFIFLATVFYGLLTGVCLILESAYQFDKYRRKVGEMIPSIILVNAGAMFASLTYASNLLPENTGLAIAAGILFLTVAALICCILSSFVLPNEPITEARFSTQSAFAAFCKNIVIYYLPLYILFGLIIFCLVYGSISVAKDITIPIVLTVIWIIFFGFSYISTNYLSDNLLTKEDGEQYKHHGLFSLLLKLRMIFSFIAVLSAIFWYFFIVLNGLNK